jgi:hypothetical protein
MVLLMFQGLGACISHHDSVVADVNPFGWSTPVTISYINSDTVSVKEAALLLRHAADARVGRIVIEAHSPSGAMARDTVAVTLAPNTASNNIQELSVAYRRGVMFAEAGAYSFTLTPTAEMTGVWSIGIQFNKE